MNIKNLDSSTLLEIGAAYYFIPTEELKKKIELSAGFRIPKIGEVFITKIPFGRENLCETAMNEKRLILNKTARTDLCCLVTLRDIYGTEPVVIPHGYEFVSFRLPVKGDTFIRADVSRHVTEERFGGYSPRVIVKEAL